MALHRFGGLCWGEPVRGDSWHRELLLRMKSPTAHRPALLSEELHDSLNEYAPLIIQNPHEQVLEKPTHWEKPGKIQAQSKIASGELYHYLKTRPAENFR